MGINLKNQFVRLFVVTLLSTLSLNTAFAFFNISETAEVVPRGQYRFGAGPQLKVSDGGGINLTAFVDSGIDEATSWRAFVGIGDVDFYTGGSLKWVPFPDYDQQPAFGFRASATLGRDGEDSTTAIKLEPLVSKKFETDHGLVIPFAAASLISWDHKGETNIGQMLTLGGEFNSNEVKDYQFGAEIGLNFKNSISYIYGYVIWNFDETFFNTQRTRK